MRKSLHRRLDLYDSLVANLTEKQKKRVDIVYNMGEEVVDKNVTDFLYAKRFACKIPHYGSSYTFRIEKDEDIRKAMRKNSFFYGYCNYNKKLVVLNLDHVLLSAPDEIVDTILHECAHAVDHHWLGTSGHGKNWKRVSRMFGNTPLRASKIGSRNANSGLSGNLDSPSILAPVNTFAILNKSKFIIISS